jgi:hypothetical protein
MALIRAVAQPTNKQPQKEHHSMALKEILFPIGRMIGGSVSRSATAPIARVSRV